MKGRKLERLKLVAEEDFQGVRLLAVVGVTEEGEVRVAIPESFSSNLHRDEICEEIAEVFTHMAKRFRQ